MPNTGYTTTSSLDDSLNSIISSARLTRDFEGVMSQLVTQEKLGDGVGLTWKEVTLGRLTATAVSESAKFDNPQQVTDLAFNITPTVVGVEVVVTDRVKARLAKTAYGKMGDQAQRAIQRKKDIDGLLVLDGFTSLGGAATVLTPNLIRAARYRISSNTTEPGTPPFHCVLHGFQIKALEDVLVSGVGTYPVGDGPTATVYKEGYKLNISGASVFEDGNITVDSSSDAKGGVFSKAGIVLVQGRAPWTKPVRDESIGGGATIYYHYDEYAYGERLGAGTTSVNGYEIYADATTPVG